MNKTATIRAIMDIASANLPTSMVDVSPETKGPNGSLSILAVMEDLLPYRVKVSVSAHPHGGLFVLEVGVRGMYEWFLDSAHTAESMKMTAPPSVLLDVTTVKRTIAAMNTAARHAVKNNSTIPGLPSNATVGDFLNSLESVAVHGHYHRNTNYAESVVVMADKLRDGGISPWAKVSPV